MCAITVSGGRVTYSGPAAGLQEYAAKIYLKAQMGIPPIANAPEVFLELCDMLIKNEKLDLAIVDTERKEKNDKSIAELSIADDKTTANNYFYETYIIFSRNLKNIIRTKELFLARIGAAVGFGFLIGSLFYRRPLTDVGVTERVAYLVFTIAFFCYTSLETLPIFLAEREIFQREYSRGAYRAISYVTAVTIVHIPFLLVLGLLFAIPSYWLVMLPNEAETFFFYIFALLCTNMAAQSFAVLISVLVPDPMAGQTAGAGLFSVMFLLSGFFITKNNIPDWWSWLHYLSIFKYAYESFVINVLLHKIETPTSTNEEIMMRFSMDNISKWRGIGVLLGYVVFYRLAFYFMLMKFYNGRRKD
jgi:ABC-type multidrug transport system permease subunit